MKRVVISLLCLISAQQPASGDLIGVGFLGEVVRINEMDGSVTIVNDTAVPRLNSLARDSQGHLYATGGLLSNQILRIDPVTGMVLSSTTLSSSRFGGLAFSPTGELFTTHIIDVPGPGQNAQLATINPQSGAVTFLGQPLNLGGIGGLTFGPTGVLYAWNTGLNNDGFGLITLAIDGSGYSDVNPLVGTSSAEIQSLEFAPDGTLYGARDRLFTIDPLTGASSSVGADHDWDIRGLAYVPEPHSSLLAFLAIGGFLRRRRPISAR
jgi:hypothetical protein